MGTNPKRCSTFRFKQFEIDNSLSAMKVGTDGVLIGAWASVKNPNKILDIGAGSGLISLMMAQRYPDAFITGIEIDPQAVSEARKNADNSPWSNRLNFVCADFADWTTSDRFDLIVSNPPFFTNGIKSPDELRATARHSDRLSPFSILDRVASLLTPTGIMAMIVPAELVEPLIFEATVNRLNPREIVSIFTQPNKPVRRALMSFAFSNKPLIKSNLTIRDSAGFNSQYRNLTKDFYLEF